MRITSPCLALIGLFLLSGCGNQQEIADSETDGAEYPYLQLVTAVGDEGLTRAYKMSEDELRQTPQGTDQQMRRAYVLTITGGLLMQKQNGDQARQAFRAAFENAKRIVEQSTDLPAAYHQPLAGIYYNGACAESLDGKAEAARATLQQAVEWGWPDMEAISGNPDLANVRVLPGFDALLAGWTEMARKPLLEAAREELAHGETFPFEFAVTTLGGEELNLADLIGKVVIVDFWGTWCPPCRAEIPSFIKLQQQYGERGLQIVGLNYENAEDDAGKVKLAKDFAEANGINYPCALGTEEIMAQVPAFEGFPTTVFVDRTGKVRLKTMGLHKYTYLESLVETLLTEDAAAPASKTPGTP